MEPVAQNLLTAENLVTGAAFDHYIELVQQGSTRRGKIAIAKVDDQVIVAIGDTNEYHVGLISRAASETIRREVCTSLNPDTTEPLPGILIEGAKFRYLKNEARVEIYDYSLSFGGFRARIFAEPTATVMERFLLERILRAGAVAESSDLGGFSSELRALPGATPPAQ